CGGGRGRIGRAATRSTRPPHPPSVAWRVSSCDTSGAVAPLSVRFVGVMFRAVAVCPCVRVSTIWAPPDVTARRLRASETVALARTSTEYTSLVVLPRERRAVPVWYAGFARG